MSEKYPFQTVERKWQARWKESGLFSAATNSDRPKCYVLTMYPYPSGVLHMGHVINYTLGDVIVRYQLLQGHNVLSPMGWDSFGLPAENAAIRTGTPPHTFTEQNITRMTAQMERAGWGYDWSREVATSHPDYYRWTQWLFLQFYKHGLAVKKKAPVNWCTSCATVLANEQVHDGSCERCGTTVEQRDMSQWFFTMSRYAQRLLDGHEALRGNWPEAVLAMQAEWIGRSEGARVTFTITETGEELPIFTTRPDTLFGVTFMSLAPEHPLIERLVGGTAHEARVMPAVHAMRRQGGGSERERAEREKVGVWTGFHVTNPVNGEHVPLWVANFALMSYGTGAVMAVPAHDQRDFEFARKYSIPVSIVIQPEGAPLQAEAMTEAYVAPGTMVNSGPFTGRHNSEAMPDIIRWLETEGHGEGTVNYRLRDWLISRQRYWGAPIPVVYCETCGIVPVPEAELPVRLPEDVQFRDHGGNPLETSESFLHCACPTCGRPARRETDTMDTFVDSSWYFLRYCDPHNTTAPFSPEAVKRWMPVDQYIGGIEHATMHLIYARFFTMVLHDLGMVEFDEPFTRLFCQGMVCKTAYYCEHDKWLHEHQVEGERQGDAIVNGRCTLCGRAVRSEMTKISKSKFNVVDPDEMIEHYGADTVRLNMLSDAPPDNMQIWSEAGIKGAWRMLNRLWELTVAGIPRMAPPGVPVPETLDETNRALRRKAHQCIERVSEAIEGGFQFNTAIARCNELVNQLRSAGDCADPFVLREVMETVIRILSPVVPHFCEELWERLGYSDSLFTAGWPQADPSVMREEQITIPVQVNGKVRDRITVSPDTAGEAVEAAALASPAVRKWTDGKTIRKLIVIPNKLVNIAVS